MIKRFLSIVLIVIGHCGLLQAKAISQKPAVIKLAEIDLSAAPGYVLAIDTTKKKIKEIPQAKRQAKPLKLGELPADSLSKLKVKPQRQRRPDGLVRPPEIPRRNN